MADIDLVKRPQMTVVVEESFDFDKHWPIGPNVLDKGDRIRVRVSVVRGASVIHSIDDVVILKDYPDSESKNELVGRLSLYLSTSPKIEAL